MANQDYTHLRLYEESAGVDALVTEVGSSTRAASIDALIDAFETGTGWPLKFALGPAPEFGRTSDSEPRRDSILAWSAPVDPGDGTAPGHLKIEHDALAEPDVVRPETCDCESDGDTDPPRGELAAAIRLADLLARLTNELTEARRALRSATAELATSAPTVAYPGRGAELGERLEAVLRGGAESLDCQAAAMYLLDEPTTELRLRAHWGLPESRLVEPARLLEGATADLEAMLGSAVVLENEQLFDLWRVPEPEFSAAVCVPISGPSTVMGTFWLFSSRPREFSDRDTNLVEILAGRVAIELEREALMRESRGHLRPT